MNYLMLLLLFILLLLCVAGSLVTKRPWLAFCWGSAVAVILVKLVEASLFLIRPWA